MPKPKGQEVGLPSEAQSRYIQHQLKRAQRIERLTSYAIKAPLIFLILVLLLCFVFAIQDQEYVLATLLGAFLILIAGLLKAYYRVHYTKDDFAYMYVPVQLRRLSGVYQHKMVGHGRTASLVHYIDDEAFNYNDGLLQKANVQSGDHITIIAYPPPKFVRQNWKWTNLMAIQVNNVKAWEV